MYVLRMALIDEWRINGSGGGMAFHSIALSRTMVALRPRAIWLIGPGPQNSRLYIKNCYHWVFRVQLEYFFRSGKLHRAVDLRMFRTVSCGSNRTDHSH